MNKIILIFLWIQLYGRQNMKTIIHKTPKACVNQCFRYVSEVESLFPETEFGVPVSYVSLKFKIGSLKKIQNFWLPFYLFLFSIIFKFEDLTLPVWNSCFSIALEDGGMLSYFSRGWVLQFTADLNPQYSSTYSLYFTLSTWPK